MTKHVDPRVATAAARAVPRAIVAAVRADGGNPAEILAELNRKFDADKSDRTQAFTKLEGTVAALRQHIDDGLKTKAGASDVVAKEQIDRINGAVDEMRTAVKAGDDSVKAIKAEIEKFAKKMEAMRAGPTQGGDRADPRTQNEHYAAYAKAFGVFFRQGEDYVEGGKRAFADLEVKAGMTTQSNPDGGYTVLPEIEKAIDATVKEISPMRDLATIRQIGAAEYKKLVNLHGTTSGWVGETGARPQTLGPQLSELKFPSMEVYAMPAASQALLDDSFLNIENWLAEEVQLEFAQKEGVAFISGDGIIAPAGFIGGYPVVANTSYAWGKIGYIATGASAGFKVDDTPPKGADCLVDLLHSVKTMYRKNGTFVANRGTLGAIRKLKDGQGNYLLNMVLRAEGFVEEVLGRPAMEMPDMPDIAANSYSVAFGDFKRGYIIVDRIGVRVLRDPFTAKPYVLFYTTKRVGGGVQNFEAIKLLKFATT